jgi:hypothetical protein
VDLTSYFEMQERNIAERSVLEQIDVEIAPDDRTGTLEARANLRADTELDAYLRIYERAVAAGRNKVEVVKYSYTSLSTATSATRSTARLCTGIWAQITSGFPPRR